MQGKAILIVEDEANLRRLLSKILGQEGLRVHAAADVTEAKEILRNEDIYVVLTDVMLPDANGLEFSRFVKTSCPLVEVIVLTAYGNIKDGVKAMKLGAFDYLTKGDGDERLPLVVAKAMEKAKLNRQLQELEHRLESRSSFAKIIGKSAELHKMIDLSKKVAVTETTVLLTGETGTGKELLAEAIHLASRRRKGPFIAINCAAIPKDLQESELFGHKRGSFTGANADKKGYFEVSNQGTIFLDELSEMSADLQAKLLRALEMKMINRVGDTDPIPIDVRIIAATNRNLINDEGKDTFRKDLYYRLSTFAIELPPLRNRLDDIELLALHFIQTNAQKMNKKVEKMSPEFLSLLRQSSWDGNVRELKNIIERAMILAENGELTVETLPNEFLESSYTVSGNHNCTDLKSVEKEHIIKVLEMTKGKKALAAKKLDIGLATLYRKIKEYSIG